MKKLTRMMMGVFAFAAMLLVSVGLTACGETPDTTEDKEAEIKTVLKSAIIETFDNIVGYEIARTPAFPADTLISGELRVLYEAGECKSQYEYLKDRDGTETKTFIEINVVSYEHDIVGNTYTKSTVPDDALAYANNSARYERDLMVGGVDDDRVENLTITEADGVTTITYVIVETYNHMTIINDFEYKIKDGKLIETTNPTGHGIFHTETPDWAAEMTVQDIFDIAEDDAQWQIVETPESEIKEMLEGAMIETCDNLVGYEINNGSDQQKMLYNADGNRESLYEYHKTAEEEKKIFIDGVAIYVEYDMVYYEYDVVNGGYAKSTDAGYTRVNGPDANTNNLETAFLDTINGELKNFTLTVANGVTTITAEAEQGDAVFNFKIEDGKLVEMNDPSGQRIFHFGTPEWADTMTVFDTFGIDEGDAQWQILE